MSRSRAREQVVSQRMVGLFVVAGADVILLVVLLAAVGVTSWTAALGISGFVLAVFGAWVILRWRQLRPGNESAASGRTADSGARTEEVNPLETLKERYAAGELTDREFEEKLDRLLESDHQVDAILEARRDDDSVEREPLEERS